MQNPFADQSTEGHERTDSVGGFSIPDTGIYEARIMAMYIGQSKSSASRSVTIIFKVNNNEHSVTVWCTGKDGKNTDKNNRMLTGYELVDDICIMTTGKGMNKQAMREVELELYDFDAGERRMMGKTIFADVVDKTVFLALQKTLEDKKKETSPGVYTPTGETRNDIQIAKAYHSPTKSTVMEAQKGIKDNPHYTEWLNRHAGNVKDNTEAGKKGGRAVQNGKPTAAPTAASQESTENLFGAS